MVVNRPGAGPAGALLSLNDIVPTCEAHCYECENSNGNDSDALSVHTGLSHDPMLHRPERQGNRRAAKQSWLTESIAEGRRKKKCCASWVPEIVH